MNKPIVNERSYRGGTGTESYGGASSRRRIAYVSLGAFFAQLSRCAFAE